MQPPDKDLIRKKILFKTLYHPIVLIPFIGGFAGLLGSFTMMNSNPLANFASMVVILLSAGLGITRLLNMDETDEQELINDIREEHHKSHKKNLDILHKKLTKDRDPRTHKLLEQLMALDAALTNSGLLRHLNPLIAVRLRADVEKLFMLCVKTFDVTLELLDTSKELPTKSAKNILLQKREEKIDFLERSVKNLEHVLDEVVRLKTDSDQTKVDRVQEELSRCLDMAKQIDEKMKETDTDDIAKIRQRYRPDKNELKTPE